MQLRHITSVLKSFLRGRAGGLIPVSYRTLVQILAHLNPEDGEWACPIDVPGCRLQWDASSLNRTGGTGAWVGHLGVLTSAQYALLDLSRTSSALTWSTPSGDVLFGGAVMAPGKSNRAPRRGHGSYWTATDTLASGRTGIARLQAPVGAIGCYLNFQHYGSDPADVAKFGILPIAAATDNTATSAYKAGTFGGSVSGVIPAPIPEANPASSRVSPQFLRSDFIPLQAVARTDFPSRGPLFDVAFRAGARPITAGIYAPVDPTTTPLVLGWNAVNEDILTTPTPQTMAAYMPTYVWAEWVYAGVRAPVVAAYGDSIFDGASATNISAGFIQKSCFASGIELYQNTVGGRTSYDTWDNLRRELPGIAKNLDAVVLAAWTPNDEIQGYAQTAVFARYLVEKSWIESMGIKVITVGPMPVNGSAVPALVRAQLLAAGIDFFDAGILMATSSTLLTWKAGRTNDYIHPNDTGYSELTVGFRQHLSARVPTSSPLRTIAQSVALMQSAAGLPGQRCLCLDPLLPSTGVECEWSPANSAWEPMRSQYLMDVSPDIGATSIATWLADSGSTKKIKIGTLPGNLIHTGKQLYADVVAETSAASGAAASGAFMTIGWGLSANLPVGIQFNGSAASSRALSAGAPMAQVEGSALVGNALRQLIPNSSPAATISVDFSAPVDIYVVLSSPTIGITYTIRRLTIKVGGE